MKVGIVGAGVAGASTAKILLSEGFECTVYEKNSGLGGVWADGYVGFGVQVPKPMYEFPDWPLPKDVPDFTPGPRFLDYLSDYCDHFGVTPRIQFSAEVIRVVKQDNPKTGWEIRYRESGKEVTDTFDAVIICTGLYSNQPYVPDFEGMESFKGNIIHNSAFKSTDMMKGKRVAVLGYGKSATDAALEASTVADETNIVIRNLHWPIPQKLANVLPFMWGTLHRLTAVLTPPYVRQSAVERVIHGVGKPLVWLFWRVVEGLLIVQCRLGSNFGKRLSLVPAAPIEIDSFGEATMVPRPEFYRSIRNGRIHAHHSNVERITENSLQLTDGTELAIDNLIVATGWRSDYSFLSEDIQNVLNVEDDGVYLYRNMIHPDLPNLFFVGSNAATFESVLTYNLQARWLAELFKGRHQLPDPEAMRNEIDTLKRWKRQWMPAGHNRGARIMLHQLHYHDELLQDFGANPKRKTGFFAPLKELVFPYVSSDYASIVSGKWETDEIHIKPNS